MLLDAKESMLRRVAADIVPGMTVNLGIGLPTGVIQYITPGTSVCLHSENGIVGVAPTAPGETPDRNLVDAGGAYVTHLPGAAFFDSAVSFAIVRSGRIDLTLLGAFEVSCHGDLANWKIPVKFTPGMGGAIELAQKSRRVGVVTSHVDRKGNPKIVSECTLPLTARGRVSRIYTDMAVFDVTPTGLSLIDIADGISVRELRSVTGAEFVISALNPTTSV
ncbi:3-oxoacid CoA-transferase subunit B [Rhodococcus sp. D-46]|uniref:3-oxoacid CoA-transferase subunit B n=1 Tax=Rhodococcus TaxID=1827 RepID=UPI001A99C831